MDEGVAIIVAAVLAIAGIFLASRQQRRLYRRQHTHKVLDKLYEWDAFNAHWANAVSFLSRGTSLSPSGRDHAPYRDAIDFILNYYEFIAGGIVAGDLDEALIRQVEEGRMARIFLRNLDYVSAIRAHYRTNLSWEHLEFICYRWKIQERDLADRAFDLILGRPVIGPFMGRRNEAIQEIAIFARSLPPVSIIQDPAEFADGKDSDLIKLVTQLLAALKKKV